VAPETERREPSSLVRPAEIAPGFTRAVGVVLPVTVIHNDIGVRLVYGFSPPTWIRTRQPSRSSSSPPVPVRTAGREGRHGTVPNGWLPLAGDAVVRSLAVPCTGSVPPGAKRRQAALEGGRANPS
jgi:hypothetical protein